MSDAGNLSDLYVDLHQRIDYIGVATNFSIFRRHVGDLWLLPDRSITQHTSDLYLPNPVFVIATETWNGMKRPQETDRLEMTEQNFSLSYPTPNWDSLGATEEQHYVIEYEGWFGYERLGPFHQQAGNSTDVIAYRVGEALCYDQERDAWVCGPVTTSLFQSYPNLTPNVRIGFEVYDVQVATDPSNLTPPSALITKASSRNESPLLRTPAASDDTKNETSLHTSRKNLTFETAPYPPPVPLSGPSPHPRPPPVQVQSPQLQPPPPDSTLKLILGATAVTALLAALGFGLYSRFHTRAEAMRSQTRERLLALIREKPGINLSEAAEAMGLARNAVQHHVRVLERVQLVRTTMEGGMRALYPVGAQAPPVPAWLRRNEICLAIVRALQAAPSGLSREEVHRLLAEVPERTRNYHLKRLLAVGAIVQTPAPDGSKRLQAAQGLPDGSAPAGANAA